MAQTVRAALMAMSAVMAAILTGRLVRPETARYTIRPARAAETMPARINIPLFPPIPGAVIGNLQIILGQARRKEIIKALMSPPWRFPPGQRRRRGLW
jgi:hypothetical protein